MSETGEFRVVRASDVPSAEAGRNAWLIESLWGAQAVGVIGGAPKCCKSWLALEMAVAVASGNPCLGRYRVPEPGPALVLQAEDPAVRVRERLLGLAAARGVDFRALDVHLILEPSVRLDLEADQARLRRTIVRTRPKLLVLDPWVRLQRVHENDASAVSAILGRLRELSREFELAIVLVHHAKKDAGEGLGQSLRGSSDFHAWGDSNLYLRRRGETLTLSAEHRSAAAPTPVALELVSGAGPVRLDVRELPPLAAQRSLEERVLGALSGDKPHRTDALRSLLRVRKQALLDALRLLVDEGRACRTKGGWVLGSPRSRFPPRAPYRPGTGNAVFPVEARRPGHPDWGCTFLRWSIFLAGVPARDCRCAVYCRS